MREWYLKPEGGRDKPLPDLSWGSLLRHWAAIEADFQRLYGIDLDSGVLKTRTWRWFSLRTIRLLAEEGSGLVKALGLRD